MQLNISEFRKRNTYENIADEIQNQTEKIDLPGISIAKQFRDTNQGSRFDDDNFLGLEKDNINKMKEQQQQLQLQNMTDQINTLGINQIRATNPIDIPVTSQQTSISAAIEDVTPDNVEYLDMTSGKRDEDEQNELEEAIDASNASEALRKQKYDKLFKNAANVENSDATYIEKLIKETGGASSSGTIPAEDPPPNKPRPKSKSKNPDLTEPIGKPTVLKPRSLSREPSAAAKAKSKAREIAEAKKVEKEEIKNAKMQAAEDRKNEAALLKEEKMQKKEEATLLNNQNILLRKAKAKSKAIDEKIIDDKELDRSRSPIKPQTKNLTRAQAKLQAKRKQAADDLKEDEERRAEEESIAFSKDKRDEVNKEGKARSKAKAKATAKIDKELEEIQKQKKELAKKESEARSRLSSNKPQAKQTGMNSSNMYDPKIIGPQIVIAQLGMAVGQKLLTEADETAFYALQDRLKIRGTNKTTPQERTEILEDMRAIYQKVWKQIKQ